MEPFDTFKQLLCYDYAIYSYNKFLIQVKLHFMADCKSDVLCSKISV